MAVSKHMNDLLEKGGDWYQPGLSLDCVIFGFHENQLKVLLLKMLSVEPWALPGGFIRKDEHIDDAATRVLRERTGLQDIFLKQFAILAILQDPTGNTTRPGSGKKDSA